MIAGFLEYQTPILTASSPEGARDFLVPSRMHPVSSMPAPGTATVQAVADVAGFDRYFQIAPCFRDEASRADRSPGEFYQLDFEMSTSPRKTCLMPSNPSSPACSRNSRRPRRDQTALPAHPVRSGDAGIRLRQAGSAQPIRIADVTEHYAGSGFGLFARIAASGGIIRAIPAPRRGTAAQFLR